MDRTVIADCHTHTAFSVDSEQNPRALVEAAIARGLDYIAVTDHLEYDTLFAPEYAGREQLDLERYFATLEDLKTQFAGRIFVATGIECGYISAADEMYLHNLAPYSLDIIVNSVHLIEHEDCYYKSFFDKRTRDEAYAAYIAAISASLDVPYPYDVVAHVGYVSRKAPYPDKFFAYEAFPDLFDGLLKKIIRLGKALEVNTHAEGTGSDFLPTAGILRRYRELGGELITLGSDAHASRNLCRFFPSAAAFLREAGFRYVFKYIDRRPVAIPLGE